MIFFDTIDSTNTWASAHFAELDDCELVAAAMQTAGRGRLDRTWISPRGNIYASFVQKGIASPLLGVAAGSLAVLDLVRELAPTEKFHIKWPNDVFRGTAKISGILSQYIAPRNGSPGGLVTGMGVNLNMSREQLASASQEATSVSILTGTPCDYEAALRRFEEILHDHAALLKSAPETLFDRWKTENGLLGKRVEFLTGDGTSLTGLFRDIANDGSVILDEDGGRTLSLNCGDVRLLTRA
jgi:BirA family biotin operon repressor/biotin-[acetyl-CoA-carboxylase] ligase